MWYIQLHTWHPPTTQLFPPNGGFSRTCHRYFSFLFSPVLWSVLFEEQHGALVEESGCTSTYFVLWTSEMIMLGSDDVNVDAPWRQLCDAPDGQAVWVDNSIREINFVKSSPFHPHQILQPRLEGTLQGTTVQIQHRINFGNGFGKQRINSRKVDSTSSTDGD